MDTHECQPLYLEIREFYEGLHMKVEQQIPMLLVERSALNEAMEGEKHVKPLIDTIFLLSLSPSLSTYFYPNCCRDIIIYLKLEDFVCLKNKLSPRYSLFQFCKIVFNCYPPQMAFKSERS